jgi:MFS family permease
VTDHPSSPPSSRTYVRAVRMSAVALLVFGFAEEIAMRFVPVLMRALNASSATIGLLGTTRDLGDALLAYPGGRLSDRWGPTRTLRLVGAISIAGYVLTAIAPNPAVVLVATALTMAWPSMGIVATFDVVARGRRRTTNAFALQAMLRRVPMVVGPLLGGVLLARFGNGDGTRAAVGLASVLASLAVLGFVRNLESHHVDRTNDRDGSARARTFFPLKTLRAMAARMKVLLAAEVLVRFSEGLPDVFIVVYVLEQSKQSAEAFGALIALRSLVSIACYLPGARLAHRTRPEVAVTLGFLAYAAFPFAIASASSFTGLALAFALGGLREIGEPSRKTLLVELAGDIPVGDAIGTYLLVRGLLVSGAGVVGGKLYALAPTLPFHVATIVAIAGALAYVAGLAMTKPAK